MLVPTDGRGDFVKVIDFGISQATWRDRLAGDPLITGTPEYMAPEQAGGLTEEIDHRANQFSLASLSYRILTGHEPFSGADPLAILYQVINETQHTALALGALARRGGGRGDQSRNVQAPGRSLP